MVFYCFKENCEPKRKSMVPKRATPQAKIARSGFSNDEGEFCDRFAIVAAFQKM